MGFRRWAGGTGAAVAELASAWADLCAVSDVLARLFLQPERLWSGIESDEQPTVTVSPEVSEKYQSLKPMFVEAFAASAEVSEQGRRAAWILGFSRVPLEWAPLAMALQSEPKLEQTLRLMLGRSPFAALEQNLNALQEALPAPVNARAQPERLEPDAATVRRLDRLWALCCSRLTAAFDCRVAQLAIEEDASLSESWALGRCFTSAVTRAIRRAYRLLREPSSVPPDLPLSSWWEGDPDNVEPLIGHQALMLDLLSSGLPLPGALAALLLEQVSDALVSVDELQEEDRTAILIALLGDNAAALKSLLTAAKEAGEPGLVMGPGLAMALSEAMGLRPRAFPSRVLQRLAWLLGCGWDRGGTMAWEDDWLSRCWFAEYQRRIRVTRCLPSSLGPAETRADSEFRTDRFLGWEPAETPPDDVDASALWCLWRCLRNTFDAIPDLARNSRVWPDCIRRLAREGFFSTALCLFECWLVHQAIAIETMSSHADEAHDLEIDALPDEDELIALVIDLQRWVAPGRLDGILHFTVARLRRGNGRYGYLAEQLEAQASAILEPQHFHAELLPRRIERHDSDRKLVRERLREQMTGYDRLPSELQEALAEAERVRDVLSGDRVFEDKDPSPWAQAYGKVAEQAVRNAFGRISPRSLNQMYKDGGGKDTLKSDRLMLGQLRWVLNGASTPERRQQLKDHLIEWEALDKTWRDRLAWVAERRNYASHSERMPWGDADAWRHWMYEGFVDLVEPLGILRP